MSIRRKVNRNKLTYARANRENPTVAEEILWNHLNKNQLGYRCTRQVIIIGYIVDFCFRKPKLVIEVDGGYHINRSNYDTYRTKVLNGLGYRVIRFNNEQVYSSTDKVIEEIRANLGYSSATNQH